MIGSDYCKLESGYFGGEGRGCFWDRVRGGNFGVVCSWIFWFGGLGMRLRVL